MFEEIECKGGCKSKARWHNLLVPQDHWQFIHSRTFYLKFALTLVFFNFFTLTLSDVVLLNHLSNFFHVAPVLLKWSIIFIFGGLLINLVMPCRCKTRLRDIFIPHQWPIIERLGLFCYFILFIEGLFLFYRPDLTLLSHYIIAFINYVIAMYLVLESPKRIDEDRKNLILLSSDFGKDSLSELSSAELEDLLSRAMKFQDLAAADFISSYALTQLEADKGVPEEVKESGIH